VVVRARLAQQPRRQPARSVSLASLTQHRLLTQLTLVLQLLEQLLLHLFDVTQYLARCMPLCQPAAAATAA
jgi:hypothetical protein